MCFFGALFNPESSHPGAHHRGVHAHIPDLRRNIQLSVAKNIPLPVFYSSTGETPKPVKRSSMDARASRLAFLLDLAHRSRCPSPCDFPWVVRFGLMVLATCLDAVSVYLQEVRDYHSARKHNSS